MLVSQFKLNVLRCSTTFLVVDVQQKLITLTIQSTMESSLSMKAMQSNYSQMFLLLS